MTSTQNAPAERRAGSLDRLNTLLETRTETLTLFGQLAGMRPYHSNNKELQYVLQGFCETLVDYTASAHFQLYRFMEEDTERRTEVRKVAEKIYPDIAVLTRCILDFNEKYDCEDHCDNFSTLEPDLSKLGEVLADRITLEDQVISIFNTQRI